MLRNSFKVIAGLVLGLGLALAPAQAQNVSLLPNAMAQFTDGNGAPYAGGKVYFYIPGTTTGKTTWQDQGQTTLNTNPIILDANGRAAIWGSGTYREILQDVNGNTIWDLLTYAPGSGTVVTNLAVGITGVLTGNGNSPITATAPRNSSNFGWNTTGTAVAIPRALEVTDFMTSAQIADGTSRTDSIDISAALNSCIATGIPTGSNCHLVAGKWKVNSQQIIMNYSAGPNLGTSLICDGQYATQIDFTGNPNVPPLLVEGTGGTVGSPTSVVYGGIQNCGLIGNAAGPILQDGKADFSDAMNQQYFNNIVIQNFNTGNSSICAQFNAVYSTTGLGINCSSGAGPAASNDLFQFRKVSFGLWHLGGSNGHTFLHLTTDFNDGNVFLATDCEVNQTCVIIDSAGSKDNSFYGGTWSWNWQTTGANGFNDASSGGDNAVYNPGQNANTTTGAAGPFLSTTSKAQVYTAATLFPTGATTPVQAGPANPTGTTSATMVMMGIGSTCTITPKVSGRIQVTVIGNQQNSGANFTTEQVRYGTGTAPTNGAAPVGTTLGSLIASQGTATTPFSNGGVATGLTLGTAYWIDLSADASGGTGSVSNLSCSVVEF